MRSIEAKIPFSLLKAKKLLVGLETATDKWEDVFIAIESIIVKNA